MRWEVVALVVAAILAGFIVHVANRPHHARAVGHPVESVPTLRVASTPPAFELPRHGGGPPPALASTKGNPTIVNLFASWCRDCQGELSGFAALADRTQWRAAVVGVDANDAGSAGGRVLLANVLTTCLVGVDDKAPKATAHLMNALPITCFLDAKGRVVHMAPGTPTAAALAHWTAVLTGTPE
jgi:thiol-disulfide isomerase/thioredoxin